MDWSHVMNQQELDDVINILDDSFPIDKESMKEYIDEVLEDHYCVYRLKVNGIVVATASYGIQGNDSDYAGDLKLLAVHKDYRKKGYAGYMVTKVLCSLKDLGCNRVYIAATDDVISMWEQFGFKYVKTFTYEGFGLEQEFHAYVYHF